MTTQRGFTLIEMAIVLVIITFLIGGLAMPLAAQIQGRRIAETNKSLEAAREAIIGYAMSHTIPNKCTCFYDGSGDLSAALSYCYLPATNWCPATGTADDSFTKTFVRHHLPCPDTDNDGKENRDTDDPNACAAPAGLFPWVTLSTAQQDAWGNRFGYLVTATFANKAQGIPGVGGGDLQVCSASGCATVDVADEVPSVIVSFGPNGWGARSVNGSLFKDPTSDDEKENTDGDTRFVSRSPSRAGDVAGEFDDLVEWISADQIRGRICPAGGCP